MTAFLASGATAGAPDLIGENYADADGTKYQPMFGQPVLVFAADAEQLARALERALTRNIRPAGPRREVDKVTMGIRLYG